jgi:hypothetical protein
MQTLWKLSQDGNSASRTLDNGSFESRLVTTIDADELATALPADPIDNSPIIRAQRDLLIQAQSWKYERNAREVRLGLKPTDDMKALDTYIQALSDVPNQKGFPDAVVWPTQS